MRYVAEKLPNGQWVITDVMTGSTTQGEAVASAMNELSDELEKLRSWNMERIEAQYIMGLIK